MIKAMIVCIVVMAIDVAHNKVDLCDKCLCSRSSYFISCDSRNLTQLPPLSPHKLQSLQVLDVSNNHLTSLNFSVVRAYTSSLRRLLASRNALRTLSPFAFRQMTSLAYLDLSWNQIVTSLSRDHFRDVVSLDHLSLAHNRIPCIGENTFKEFRLLSELDLNHNRLTSEIDDVSNASCFSRDNICDLRSLIVLRISGNSISRIFERPAFFSCLPNLTLLEASNCVITFLNKNVFVGLNHLISLDLSDNSISHWPSGTLESTTSLVYVDLSQNFIPQFPFDFLQSCPDVTHLQIRNNLLSTVDYRWLEDFGKQQVSNLSKSLSVTRVQTILARKDKSLEVALRDRERRRLYLDWSGNPFACDCDIIAFVGWLTDEGKWLNDVDGYRDVTCFYSQTRGIQPRDVYIDGEIHWGEVNKTIPTCVEPEPNSVAMTSLHDRDVAASKSKTRPITIEHLNTTLGMQSNTSSVRGRTSPPLPLIVVVFVVIDAIMYVIIFVVIRKKMCRRFRNTSVTPSSQS